MQITRRTLLKSGVVGAAVVGAAGTAAYLSYDKIRLLQPSELVSYLKSNFDYLTFNIDDAQFTAFANEYLEYYREVPRETWYVLRGGDEEKHKNVMDDFAMTFLMSTDFFKNGADESKPVNYVMFYHPYRSPCWNPLSMSAGSA